MLGVVVKVLSEECSISVYSGAKLFFNPNGMSKRDWPLDELIHIEGISSFKPPHMLQACTGNSPNTWQSIVCKTTKSRPNLELN